MASGRLVDYLGSGVIASRPASLTLHTDSVGLWYATDTNILSAWDGSTWTDVTSSSSVVDFTDLGDVPASYVGEAGKVVAVNVGETGLEFIAASGTGTVTSVDVANATGITWTGNPITTAGTLTPALSANLQAWHGLATSAKQDADADLTTIAGLTATTDNFMQAKSSAWASRTVAQVTVDLQADGIISDSVGFRTIPQNSQSAAYTLVAADSGKHIFHPSADTTARIWTIPDNASVAYPIGTALTFINQNAAGVITIAITSDTMRLAGAGTTGSRTLAANGIATAVKVTSTEWIISGTGLT